MSDLKMVEAPAGVEGQGFFATSLDQVIGLARANSIWPLPFATSCCGIEFMATMGSNYDLARFGSERMSFSPRQADLLMVMGTIAKKWDQSSSRFMSKWLSQDGLSLLVLALPAEGFLILIVCFRELIELFLLMFMCQDALLDQSKLLMG